MEGVQQGKDMVSFAFYRDLAALWRRTGRETVMEAVEILQGRWPTQGRVGSMACLGCRDVWETELSDCSCRAKEGGQSDVVSPPVSQLSKPLQVSSWLSSPLGSLMASPGYPDGTDTVHAAWEWDGTLKEIERGCSHLLL